MATYSDYAQRQLDITSGQELDRRIARAKEPDTNSEMQLPKGKTCSDCRNAERCDMLFGAVRRAFTSCDFWPSRYVPKDIEKCGY